LLADVKRRLTTNNGDRALYRLQETLFGDTRDAPIGHQIEILALRLDQGQPHLHTAFEAWHLDRGLKARAGRRGPGYLHRYL
jgi:hypothetical protein